MKTANSARPVGAVPLSSLIDGWVSAGLLSPAQASRLTETTTRPVLVQRSLPGRAVLIEALAYLGGAIVATASLLLGLVVWHDLSGEARLGLLAGTSAVLLTAGLLTPAVRGAATGRLRSTLWVAAVVAAAAGLTVAADLMDLNESSGAVLVTCGATVVAAALWFGWHAPAQQLTTMVAAAAGGAALVAQQDVPDELMGLGVWTVGVVWALLGWCGLTSPRKLGQAGGSAMAVFGAMMTASSDAGTVFTLATLVILLMAALLLRDPLMLGVGALGVVVNVPAAVSRWFPGSVSVPVALLVVGVLVVVGAVAMARRGQGQRTHQDPGPGSPMLALSAASVVVASAAAVVATVARMD